MKYCNLIHPRNANTTLITEQGGEEIGRIDRTAATLRDDACTVYCTGSQECSPVVRFKNIKMSRLSTIRVFRLLHRSFVGYSSLLFCPVLYCVVLYGIVLYCTALKYVVLYLNVLH